MARRVEGYRPLVLSDPEPVGAGRANAVRASAGGRTIDPRNLTVEDLAHLRGGYPTSSGSVVDVAGAMRVAVAYRCTHILAGACGNLPIDLYRRVSETVREPAANHPLRAILQRPNSWQTSSEFRKMLTAHAVLKGNGFALKIMSRGRLLALWPLRNPDRMTVKQRPDMTLAYQWTREDGSKLNLEQSDVLHLRGLTLDGISGIGVIAHARQALGLSLGAEEASARMFGQGVIAGLVLSKPGVLQDVAFERLKSQLEETHSGAENARKTIILEDDLKVDGSLMSGVDLQFLESRAFERSDVGMFFGVPPHMYGDTDKSTSWGSGIEAQGAGFVTFTANDWFVMWEEALARDCLDPVRDADLYIRLQRQALLRGDLKARWGSYVQGLQWGVFSPDDVRGFEDMNPRPDGEGGQYYDPPNTAGGQAPTDPGTNDAPDPAP